MRYLLDTNTISDFIRHPRGASGWSHPRGGRRGRLHKHHHCGRVEVRREKRGSRKLATRVADALDVLEVLPLESPADTVYGVIRASLEKGRPIAANDLLIAAHAFCNIGSALT
jgi:tRNA(fMet)-specific endonuclease VapC